MAKQVDYVLQDSAVLIETVKNNRETLAGKGFTPVKEEALNSSYEQARLKTGAQIKAFKFVTDKTIVQNKAIEKISKFISKIQMAAKSAFVESPPSLKRFRIGETQPHTVKGLSTWGEYFSGLLLEFEEVLLDNGLVQQDIADFNNAYAELLAADAAQESAKKLQVSATIARDEAVDKLKIQVNKTRSFIKAALAGNAELLALFKPIAKGSGGRTEVPETPEEPTEG